MEWSFPKWVLRAASVARQPHTRLRFHCTYDNIRIHVRCRYRPVCFYFETLLHVILQM